MPERHHRIAGRGRRILYASTVRPELAEGQKEAGRLGVSTVRSKTEGYPGKRPADYLPEGQFIICGAISNTCGKFDESRLDRASCYELSTYLLVYYC